jgi:hypothetical protein
MEELLGPQADEILALATKRSTTKVALPTPQQEEIHDEPSDDDLIY